MQAIFAYHTGKIADYNICKKSAQDYFLPDMNSMEEQDKEALSKHHGETGHAFDQAFVQGFDTLSKDLDSTISDQIQQHTLAYENKISSNQKDIKKRLIADVKGIYDDYIKLLVLVIEIQDAIEKFKKKRKIEHNNFAKNLIVNLLKDFDLLENEKTRKAISWDTNLVKTWYKEYISTDEKFEEYDNRPRADFDDDKAILLHIFKGIIFKNEHIEGYLESEDLGWTENKVILKSMLLKTIKSIDADDPKVTLMELSKNWEEDLGFLKALFDLSIDKESDYEALIKKWSKNWDISRVALTDRVILEMALAEMMNFSSIPIKVSINEYIELSKLYSTPKSKQFVNGLLDVISVELQKEGLIKKSGRGLLDNK